MKSKLFAHCNNCNSEFEMYYGTESKDNHYEVYGCDKCQKMFSLSNNQELICPFCSNKNLIKYNPNKNKNLKYYIEMKKKHLLSEKDYNNLINYWTGFEDDKCIVCKKKTLKWKQTEE
jgi:DNA-directed RNA polymerase subunit RPC12/RpoP